MCPLKLRLGAFSGPGRPLTHPKRRSAGYRSPVLPGRNRPGRGRLLGSYSFSFRWALKAVPIVDLPQPVPFLQRPRKAQDVACITTMIIIRFFFSFWISCALLRFAQPWYFMFWGVFQYAILAVPFVWSCVGSPLPWKLVRQYPKCKLCMAQNDAIA